MKKQNRAGKKSSARTSKHALKIAMKAEATAHRDAVHAEKVAHKAAVKAEARAHKQAMKAERRAHKAATHGRHVVVEPEAVDIPHSEPMPPEVEVARGPILHADAQSAYDDANRALEAARIAFAELDWTTHTREDWIAASARLRGAWAAVDAARAALEV